MHFQEVATLPRNHKALTVISLRLFLTRNVGKGDDLSPLGTKAARRTSTTEVLP